MPERREPLQVRFDEAAGRWVVLATVLGSSLAMLDATVVNVALERIGTDLGADLAALQWTLSSYSLTLASLILLGGSLGDRFGRRRVFIIGTAWFAIASALCGLAPNVATLVAVGLFASRQFTVANLFTFTTYAALGAVFFLLVLDLQVVGGYDPLAAGLSMVPVTAVMLALSPSSGALAQRIGPKLQLTVGPLAAAAGLLLTQRIGPGASYPTVVLPAVTLFGLGLAALVAPLTATVLAA